MLISVVIPTYNRRETLARCLASLVSQNFPAADFEIIVIADGCTDDTIPFVRQLPAPCSLRLIEQANLGQGAARNSGIRAATARYVLFLDDDFVCEPGLLSAHLRAHRVEGTAAFGPILHDGSESLPAIAIDREIRPFYQRKQWNTAPQWFPPNSSIEKHILLACGGYDETFSRAREDTDLALRLAEMRVRFTFAPDAIVRQMHRKSAARIVREAALFGASDVRLLAKHPGFLPYSNLSRLLERAYWARLLRRFIALAPLSLEPLLRPFYFLADCLRGNPFAREFGIRLLNWRRYIVWSRAAAREAGGWKRLLSLLETAQAQAKGRAA